MYPIVHLTAKYKPLLILTFYNGIQCAWPRALNILLPTEKRKKSKRVHIYLVKHKHMHGILYTKMSV